MRRALELQPNYPEAHCNLGNALRALGEPAAVNSYQEAVRLRPDYVTDEVMPTMTGTELARAMHQLRPDLPIVLMTGYAGPVPIDRIHDSGIREVVRKPLLSATIAHCLARHLH